MALSETTARAFRRYLPAECFVTATGPFATDFGGSQNHPPGLVLMVRAEEETCTALRIARETLTPVRVRGAGHSCFGQTLNKGGVVLLNFGENASDMFLTDDLRLNVSGRSYWGNVVRGLRRYTAAVPVVTDYLDLTVGGTLSVGGYGLASIATGSQADMVEAVRLIKPDGTAAWCSEKENSELFRYCFGSLGQVGIIERVVLRIKDLPPKVQVLTRLYRDTGSLALILERLAGDNAAIPDHFWAALSPGEIVAEYGFHSPDAASARKRAAGIIPDDARHIAENLVETDDYETRIHRMRAQWVEQNTRCRRLWCDYLLDPKPARTFLEFLSESIMPKGLGVVYILACKVDKKRFAPLLPHNFRGTSPAPAIRFGQGLPAMRFGFGLYCMVPEGDRGALARAEEAHALCLAKCRELGGRPYRYGWCQLTEKDKQTFYGSDLTSLRKLRGELDPHDILNSGTF